LQILETLIKTRWKILPTEEQTGIKSFVVSKIVALSSDEDTLRKQKTLVSKINMVLIQILKHEWPAKWPNFIQEMLASCHTNLSLCENNMVILKLLR
jgi:exportin-1